MSGVRRSIVLATGGTGGHVLPAQSLARALATRGFAPVLFTDRRGLAMKEKGDFIDAVAIPAATPSAGGVFGRALGMAETLRGTLISWRLLGRIRPGAVVGFGGYASVPAVLAASLRRLPTIIHEQNALLGRANAFLAPRVDCIATSFTNTRGLSVADRDKATVTGNPVRAAIAALGSTPYPAPGPDGPFTVLVIGGSQGAHIFSTVVPAAIRLLPETLRDRIRLSQQCRKEDLDSAATAYRGMKLAVELAPYFDDMAERLAKAQLVIARAGASTVAELVAAGRPALLVPYPHAADDHQTDNANALDEAGAAWLMPQSAFTPEALAARLEAFMGLPLTLEKAAASARRLDRGDAAAHLADLVTSVALADGGGSKTATIMREIAA
ncbi:MAG: undecaprenyldiphospho-muramoylpentapeptide beta-N-acetylglucosaminyltransferase [Alphaproteobacteria bacterium]